MRRSLFSVGHRATLGAAWALMRAHEIRHLPVFDDERRLIGLVSDHDLQQVVLDRVLGEPPGEAKRALDRLWVDEVMTWGVVTVGTDTEIRQAALIMRQRSIGALPVAERGRVVGILTATDVIQALLAPAGKRKGGTRTRRAGRRESDLWKAG
jgi:CBS domain-containing protein